MGRNAYDVVTVPLDTARLRGEIVPRDKVYTSVTVIEMPAGTDFSLHIGERQAVPVEKGYEFHQSCGERGGLLATHPAQPGVTVKLYVSFSGALLGVET